MLDFFLELLARRIDLYNDRIDSWDGKGFKIQPKIKVEIESYDPVAYRETMAWLRTKFMSVDNLKPCVARALKEAIEIAEKFIKLDLADIGCFLMIQENHIAYVDLIDGDLNINKNADRITSDRDLVFCFVHELRHIWQHKHKGLKIKTPDIWMYEGAEIDVEFLHDLMNGSAKNTDDLAPYFQLPWEADANGFAHHVMGSYIPESYGLSAALKFCIFPKDLDNELFFSYHNQYITSS
jgi:hypothetical protein